MRSVDELIDVPALEWCSIMEAVLWIECGRKPVDSCFENSLPGRRPLIGVAEDGKTLTDPSSYPMGASILHNMCIVAGGVTLRGRPAIGPQWSELRPEFGEYRHADWGDITAIPRDKIASAGQSAFLRAGQNGILTDGWDYKCPVLPKSAWSYSCVQVNFEQVARLYPHPGSKELRFGGEAKLLEPAPETDTDRRETPEGSLRSRGRPGRSDWPVIAALAAIIQERESTNPEILSDAGKWSRLNLILDGADRAGCSDVPRRPSRSAFVPQALAAVTRAMSLYEKGAEKSPPREG